MNKEILRQLKEVFEANPGSKAFVTEDGFVFAEAGSHFAHAHCKKNGLAKPAIYEEKDLEALSARKSEPKKAEAEADAKAKADADAKAAEEKAKADAKADADAKAAEEKAEAKAEKAASKAKEEPKK